MGAGDGGVDGCAWLGRTDEGVAVDAVQSKLVAVPEDPFEVVHQRPVQVAEHGDALVDHVEQAGERRLDEAGSQGVVVCSHAVLGHKNGDAGSLICVLNSTGEREWLDAGPHLVDGRIRRWGYRTGAVVVDPLVVLDADEIVVTGEVQPALVDLCPLAVANRGVATDGYVIDDGDAQTDRRIGIDRASLRSAPIRDH